MITPRSFKSCMSASGGDALLPLVHDLRWETAAGDGTKEAVTIGPSTATATATRRTYAREVALLEASRGWSAPTGACCPRGSILAHRIH